METRIIVFNEGENILTDDPCIYGLEFTFPFPINEAALRLIDTMIALKKQVVIMPQKKCIEEV